MKKAVVIILFITIFLFTACSIQIKTEATATEATETETATADLPAATPAASPATEPTQSSTPHPTADLSAILGMWYRASDAQLYIEFHADGTADFHRSDSDCTGYGFDSYTMTGTIYLDDGGGSYPYGISIEGGSLILLDEAYARAPSWYPPIAGGWICTTDHSMYIVFYANETAYFYGSPAECTGYEFDEHTMKGKIYLDDGGGPYPYDISIAGGSLNLLGEVYARSSP